MMVKCNRSLLGNYFNRWLQFVFDCSVKRGGVEYLKSLFGIATAHLGFYSNERS